MLDIGAVDVMAKNLIPAQWGQDHEERCCETFGCCGIPEVVAGEGPFESLRA